MTAKRAYLKMLSLCVLFYVCLECSYKIYNYLLFRKVGSFVTFVVSYLNCIQTFGLHAIYQINQDMKF